jgi:putative acetyltransferase
MILRAEHTKDYNPIARLTYSAFLNWRRQDLHIHEADMISLARQSATFDPQLSIVAEERGEIMGHILLYPSYFMAMGVLVKGVIPGPISVKPDIQKQGLGTKLIDYAHTAAKERGYEFALLCGHPEYYPKFGYIQNMFSLSGTKIKAAAVKEAKNIKPRPLKESDVEIIDKWQVGIRGGETLALLFEKNVMGYHAFSKEKTGEVLEISGRPAAYVKYKTYETEKVDFVFFDKDKLEPVIDYMLEKSGKDTLEINMPHDVFKILLPENKYTISDIRQASDAFMILPFYGDGIINKYIRKVKKDKDSLGVICFPPYCDQ